ncbi:protein artichoke-like [Mytilus californianus]|uniref:protein artichoke-like n=1 Tax=Mytilus californianus TaxID=6549 RepID=UPI0022479365|nr:protein artichoke-like [Mytilus californianus]
MMFILWIISALLSSVYCQTQANTLWSANDYWNDRYSLGYTETERDYGMWSYLSTKSNGYMDVPTGAPSCSGCACGVLKDDGILQSCSGTVTIAHYSFPNISSETFAVSTSEISIRHCSAFVIVGQTFVNLTSLTKLTIENSGITTMPDLGNTQITELNLMFNSIEIKTNFKGSLPTTITHVALTGNNIYWIPNVFLKGPNLRSVSLGGNSFINFPVLGFGSVPSLVYFGIENNQLRRLSVQHINNFKETTQLHLNFSYNVLDYIQPYAFSGIPNIKVLELHQNSLASIAKGVFENLTTLVHLDLHANNLQTLNKEAMKDLEYLEELRLHSQKTPMTTLIFNSMINVGKSLKYLFISSNALTHIPHQVFMENSFDNIIQLHLDNNAITNVTELDANGYGSTLRSTYNEKKVQLDPFSTMSSLNILYLHINAITHVTSTDYCRLTSLTELYLNQNELTEDNIDDDSFTCVTTLQILHLGSNYLQYVPAALTNSTRLPSINALYVTNNKLTFIEAGTFSDLSTLRSLYLYSNKIISIEDNAFPDLIRVIALQSNDFRFIHENQFSNLSNMYRLNLANNDIDYLPDNVFSGCTSLTQLVLNGNRIKQIKKMHLENCPLTTQLYLHDNEIGWIEDGALDHIASISYLYLHNNRLYSLPMGGDFNDMTVTYFYLHNNRISAILNGTFKNFVVSFSSLDLSQNRIATIEGNAFTDVTVSYIYSSLKLTNNKIKDIQPYAFNNVNAPSMQFDGDTMGVIPSYAFNDITTTTFNLYNIGITEIQENAFNNFNVGHLYLYGNSISSLDGPIFTGTSSVSYLYLNRNNIAYIKANVFDSVTVTYLYLNENSLTIYPIALSRITPREIYLEDNEITGIPDGSLAGQTNLQIFSMYNNKLTEITATTFTSATNLQSLMLQNNEIQYIEEGSFNGLNNLETLDLNNNQLSYFPAVALESLTSLNLGGNMIETLGGFPVNNSIVVNLTGNALGCECSTAFSLYYVKDTVTGGTCASPSALAGVTFEAGLANGTSVRYYDTLNDTKFFQCSAENIVGTAVSSTEMKIQWNRPSYLYAVFDSNDTNVLNEAVGANVSTWNYIVTCTSTTAATLTKTETVTETIPSTSHSASVTFKDTDGLLPLNSYDCVIQLEVNGYTSAKSIPETVYIQQTQSNTTVANSLPVTVYDFTISNDDFGTAASMTPSNPYHVISPTGSWPAISTDPTSDTFSDWFRDTSANIKLDREITLTVDNSSGSDVHNYYSDSYFLADDSGYGAEGQTDCGGILHNFFYTSAIRTGLKFSGNEKLTFGGGEELWVFINKVLVIEIIADRSSASVACQTVDLSAAAATVVCFAAFKATPLGT